MKILGGAVNFGGSARVEKFGRNSLTIELNFHKYVRSHMKIFGGRAKFLDSATTFYV